MAGDAIVDPRSPAFVEAFSTLLLERKLVDEVGLLRAKRAQAKTGTRFDAVLTELGLVSEADLGNAIANFLSLPVVATGDLPKEPVLASHLPQRFLMRHRILPLSDSNGTVTLALADPFDGDAIKAIAYLLGRPIACCLISPSDFETAMGQIYGGDEDEAPTPSEAELPGEASEDDVERLRNMASEAPVVRLVADLIGKAVEMRASDIHIEPFEDGVRVRFRIDGELQHVQSLPPGMRAAVTSRVKIMAKLNIAERRLPQDGRIRQTVRGRDIDIRVATIPTLYGENLVLRILDRSGVMLELVDLGFDGQVLTEFQRLLQQPNGIMLVTGPTGSGKTTTLYAALSRLNRTERKIFTVEDPVEYRLAGITQVQVQRKIGLTFANALRSILRQDPDIIMIGEIRDLETAQIAVQSSLTGHLVLSTLHTNNAAATLTRLLDMGTEAYLLASTLTCVLAQRLVRRLCSTCAQPAPLPAAFMAEAGRQLGAAAIPQPTPRRAAASGCPKCRNTGYSGRTSILELLVVTDRVRQLILKSAPDQEIEAEAVSAGMRTMYQHGLQRVLRGETTLEEVLEVTVVAGA